MKTDNELEIQRIELPVEDRKLLFDFMGDDPGPTIDFNWLMPVVEKIDSLGYHVTIMKTRAIIATTLNVQNHIQSIHPGYSMIEVVYCAVVEFIKWYNNQKIKPVTY
jgi:hypothetical protein